MYTGVSAPAAQTRLLQGLEGGWGEFRDSMRGTMMIWDGLSPPNVSQCGPRGLSGWGRRGAVRVTEGGMSGPR